MRGKISNMREAQIFVQGATLLGTGGGGFPGEGLRVLDEALTLKGSIEWQDVEDIDDDAMAICTFLMGSTAPMTEEKASQMDKLGLTEQKFKTNMVNAIKEWEAYTGVNVDVVVPLEIGGSNLPAPMAVATMMDKKIVDGDYAGRAIPEIFQISLQKEDVSLCPAVSFDKYGNISIMKSAISLTIAERVGKYLSEVAFGSTAIAGFPITGKQLKRLLVKGSVSQAYRVGKLIEKAKSNPSDLDELLKTEGIIKIFQGTVFKKDWKDENGYYMGYHYLKGENQFEGKELKMYFKNETHIVWIDGEYKVSSPDLICTIEPDLLMPLRNDDIIEGTKIAVFQKPCNTILKDEKIKKYIDPQYFGFDIEYKEI